MFSKLSFPTNCETHVIGNTLILTKWLWDYDEFLCFQSQAQEFIRLNKALKIYIFCNHSHLFTIGRGNERGNEQLVEFDPKSSLNLKFPVHKIHRGGGITFHYPGQWIFYPIVSIDSSYTLDNHMCWMLKIVKQNLELTFDIDGLVTAKKLMGIWKDRKKVASIGVGMKRFVTEHGLALNLISDKDMFNELSKINPCGMDSLTYKCIDEYVNETEMISKFHKNFLKKLQ